jgi:hypothetical protein
MTPIVTMVGKDLVLLTVCKRTIDAIIARVPPKYLQGLSKIVIMELVHASSATKKRARRKSKDLLLGSYFPSTTAPHIEIYADSFANGYGTEVMNDNRERTLLLGLCLFHELGHHITRTIAPKHGPREAVVGQWERQLTKLVFGPTSVGGGDPGIAPRKGRRGRT